MPDQVGTSQVIRFATFEVDLQAQELRKARLRLKLSGQPFQVLAILLEQPGVVVTREEPQKRLWPDTFVDADHNLNYAINKIREALGDSSRCCRGGDIDSSLPLPLMEPLQPQWSTRRKIAPPVCPSQWHERDHS